MVFQGRAGLAAEVEHFLPRRFLHGSGQAEDGDSRLGFLCSFFVFFRPWRCRGRLSWLLLGLGMGPQQQPRHEGNGRLLDPAIRYHGVILCVQWARGEPRCLATPHPAAEPGGIRSVEGYLGQCVEVSGSGYPRGDPTVPLYPNSVRARTEAPQMTHSKSRSCCS